MILLSATEQVVDQTQVPDLYIEHDWLVQNNDFKRNLLARCLKHFIGKHHVKVLFFFVFFFAGE